MGNRPSSFTAQTGQAFQGNVSEPGASGEWETTPATPHEPGEITKTEFEALANFRYAIRCFLRFSELEARKARVTPQQYQLLLAIKGYPDRESATVSELAERLQMRQHSMVGLIDRTEAQGLVRRKTGTVDRRLVYICLAPEGEELLRKLAVIHRRELRAMSEALRLPFWENHSSIP